ncbi:hypothetical protein ACO0RG_001908 [Hanseniaspora osmophila]
MDTATAPLPSRPSASPEQVTVSLLQEQLEHIKLNENAKKKADYSEILVPTAGGDPNVPLKNKAVTKPIELDSSTGEVLVRKATGKTKLRKGQSEQEYQEQKKIYQDNQGPLRKEEGWFAVTNENIPLDTETQREHCVVDKQKRALLNSRVYYYYYRKDYQMCVKLVSQLVELYTSDPKFIKLCKKDIHDLQDVHSLCIAKLETDTNS